MNTVVIGAQFGDEGKGKIVDYLANENDLIIRYSGGSNAGHTVVINEKKYALHLIPSGILNPGKKVILGTGMVINFDDLMTEIKMLNDAGIDTRGRILISDRAHIVLPSYKEEDKKIDAARKKPIGTTGRGIGVAYSLKSSRDGIRVVDITGELSFEGEDLEYINRHKQFIIDNMVDMAAYLKHNKPKNILFEGAQGALLDLDTGTYPFVSSGPSCAAGACIGGGVGPRDIDRIIGVFKAYTSRVGNGPFPSEYNDKNLENYIRETGHEYGTTTGRPRRVGYLDLIALDYACRVNSITDLCLTHLDIYDALESFDVCVAYRYQGKDITNFPSDIKVLEGVEPVIISFEGWMESISDIEAYSDLPEKAKIYIRFIEEYTNTKISIISVGPDRSQTIER